MPNVANDLTVVITTIPTRSARLQIALQSVANQTLSPSEVIVQCDTERLGAPGNRDNGLAKVKTKYVAFLDDDDYFYPEHLELLYNTAVKEDADLVYSWFDVDGGTDPFPENFGKPWDPKNPVQTTVTTLGKTDSYREAGGFSGMEGLTEEELFERAQGNAAGEDFRLVYKMNLQNAKIVHLPKRTWAYVHWRDYNGGNTSGLASRW